MSELKNRFFSASEAFGGIIFFFDISDYVTCKAEKRQKGGMVEFWKNRRDWKTEEVKDG